MEKFDAYHLVENMPTAAYVTSVNGDLLYCNSAFEELVGVSCQDDVNVIELYQNPEERAQFLRKINRKGEILDHPLDLVVRNETMHCLVTALAVKDMDQIVGYQGIIRDVTDYVRINQKMQLLIEEQEEKIQRVTSEIREENRQKESILDTIDEAIISTGPDMEVSYVNRSFVDMTGYTLDDVVGSNPAELISEYVTQEQADNIRNAFENLTVYEGEMSLRRKDGKPYDVEVRFTPVIDEERVIGYNIRLMDITGRRTMEKSRAEFAQLLSHEVGTKVSVIGAYTDLLRLDPEIADRFEFREIRKSVNELESMMQRVVDHSTIEARLHTQEWTDVPIERVMRVCQDKYSENDLEITFDHSSEIIVGVELGVTKALDELVDNALKFSTGKKVQVKSDKQGNYTVLSVISQGRPILPKETDRIFEIFQKGEIVSDAGDTPGFGIGLATVRKILDYHGGEVRLETAELDDSYWHCFSLFFPDHQNGIST